MPTIQGPTQPHGFAVVPGGAIAVPLGPAGGLDTGDALISVLQVTDPATVVVDLTAEATIPAADRVQLSTTDTTGDFLLITWREDR